MIHGDKKVCNPAAKFSLFLRWYSGGGWDLCRQWINREIATVQLKMQVWTCATPVFRESATLPPPPLVECDSRQKADREDAMAPHATTPPAHSYYWQPMQSRPLRLEVT